MNGIEKAREHAIIDEQAQGQETTRTDIEAVFEKVEIEQLLRPRVLAVNLVKRRHRRAEGMYHHDGSEPGGGEPRAFALEQGIEVGPVACRPDREGAPPPPR